MTRKERIEFYNNNIPYFDIRVQVETRGNGGFRLNGKSGISYKEICKLSGFSQGNVRSDLSFIRRQENPSFNELFNSFNIEDNSDIKQADLDEFKKAFNYCRQVYRYTNQKTKREILKTIKYHFTRMINSN